MRDASVNDEKGDELLFDAQYPSADWPDRTVSGAVRAVGCAAS